jgi:hypothetical protein
MDVTNQDTATLFTQYMDVVNRSIEENRDEFLYKQLLKLGEKLIGDKKIGAAIYQRDPDEPHDWFTLTFKDGKFYAEHGKHAPDISWKVKEEHLRNVVSNPDPYVKSPAKLDLDWLKTRLQIGT